MEGDNGLPDFGEPGSQPIEQSRKSRPRPTRRPTKKSAKKRAAPAPKPAKRVPKKRRVRKSVSPIVAMPAPAKLKTSEVQVIKGIGILLTMSKEERNLVIAIVQGLSDK